MSNAQKYERAGTLTLNQVFPHVGKKQHAFCIDDKVYIVKMRSLRYRLFSTKGIECVVCGIVGTHFAIERSKGQRGQGKYHLNLYATVNGQEILMTKDHIVPKSKGGPDRLDNLQTMCTTCNGKKGNNYEQNEE